MWDYFVQESLPVLLYFERGNFFFDFYNLVIKFYSTDAFIVIPVKRSCSISLEFHIINIMLHFFCCPPGGSGFKPDPSLMDFGQSSPEDEDLYSTR